MSVDISHAQPRDAADHQHEMDATNNPRSNLSMHQAQAESYASGWHELFTVGGKIPNRRAYHTSFAWNNE